jgi:GT2 family glycosyltransferase
MDKTQEPVSALLVVVTYRSSASTVELVQSVRRWSGGQSLHVLIVDNLPVTAEIDRICSAVRGLHKAEVLESSRNLGYFGAAHFALDHYLAGGHELPNWVIVCNHDVTIDDQEFLRKLLCEDYEAVGVIAPRIQNLPSYLDQNPFMRNRPGRFRWAQLRLVGSNYALATVWDWLWRRKSAFRSWFAARRTESTLQKNAEREFIYAPHGSFIIFSRRFFEAGGYLDKNLFLYGEEISVAEICRLLSLPVIHEPALRVLHNEHQSTGNALNRFTHESQRKAIEYLTVRYFAPRSRQSVDRMSLDRAER